MELNAEQLMIVHDIERQLCARLHDLPAVFYSDGATDATVFNLGDKYLVKISDLKKICFAHPTYSEGIFELLLRT